MGPLGGLIAGFHLGDPLGRRRFLAAVAAQGAAHGRGAGDRGWGAGGDV